MTEDALLESARMKETRRKFHHFSLHNNTPQSREKIMIKIGLTTPKESMERLKRYLLSLALERPSFLVKVRQWSGFETKGLSQFSKLCFGFLLHK